MTEKLITKHGGYRNLKSFQMAQLIYDLTVLFCDRYIDKRSRTHDQMVQAARSGVQNIAEGSQASGTSKKFEIKLTSVARASLEELKLDYEDFLRQRSLEQWQSDNPILQRFKAKRFSKLAEIRIWVSEEREIAKKEKSKWGEKHRLTQTNTDKQGQGNDVPDMISGVSSLCKSVPVSDCPCVPSSSQLVANAALSLLNICCYLLERQIESQAEIFEREGGFTERMYKIRKNQS